jgi:N-acetylneuraminic acid mutarotase
MRAAMRFAGWAVACAMAGSGGSAIAAEVSSAAPMPVPLAEHVAMLLPTGRVLVTGGEAAGGPSSGAWLYDPGTNRWTPAAAPGAFDRLPGAALRLSGQVLAAGGSQARSYDPVADAWTDVAPLPAPREQHTTTRLQSGELLVVGGFSDAGAGLGALRFAADGSTWTDAGSVGTPRGGHTATLLRDGSVLVTGGMPTESSGAAIAATERYMPATQSWVPTASLLTGRRHHTATLLGDGRVLVVGGQSLVGTALATSEIFDPVTNVATPAASMPAPRQHHSASLTPDGRVVVVGGSGSDGMPLGEVIVYDPANDAWQPLATLATPRQQHGATWLPNGELLLTGGRTTGGAPTGAVERLAVRDRGSLAGTGSAPGVQGNVTRSTILPSGRVLMLTDGSQTGRIFDPASGEWSATGPMSAPRSLATLTLLPSGQVLVAGGSNLDTAERYDEATNEWTPVASMSMVHRAHQAVLLRSGRVLVISGFNNVTGEVPVAEIYDPASDTWTLAAPPLVPRHYASATLLHDGRVLLAGGFTAGGVTNHAELFDPVANTWTATGAMTHPRNGHMAALLHDGQVLVAGGADGARIGQRVAERYDPTTGTWQTAGMQDNGRENSAMVLLPSGRVMVSGGFSSTPTLTFYTDVDLYDPVANRWLAAPAMSLARAQHWATLLNDGRVLLMGGVNSSGFVDGAELFDEGLSPDPALRPQIDAVNASLLETSRLVVSGTGFLPAPDAADGSANASATNHPVFQLQRIDNDQVRFLPNDALVPLSDGSFTARGDALAGFPAGPVRVRAWVNGVPSDTRQSTFAVPPGPLASAAATGGALLAQVSWDHPYTGGAAIDYTVTASNGTSATCTNCDSLDIPLPPGTYTFEVSFESPFGAGGASVTTGPATVVRDGVEVTVLPDEDVPVAGQPVRIVVTVAAETSAAFEPEGSAIVSGGGATCTIAQLDDGAGACELAFAQPGPVTVQANYAGSALFEPGTGATLVNVTAPQIVITPDTLADGQVAVPYAQTSFVATGGAAPYTFELAAGALPAGMALTAQGVLSGTPAESGVFDFDIGAEDGNGFEGSVSLSLTIMPAELSLLPDTLPQGNAGAAYSQAFTASGGIAPYAFALASGALPPGVDLDSDGVLAGTPTAAGSFAFRVRASDSSGGTGPATVERDYVLVVNAPGIVVTPAAVPDGQVAVNYPAVQFQAAGGAPPYRFDVADGALPAGLALSASGALAGTPTQSGAFAFTVRATDGNDFTGTVAANLSIANAVLELAPDSLPPAEAGAPYSVTLQASGGIAPYRYAIVSGALPDGLGLGVDGLLAGTPTQAGSFALRVEARDSSGGAGPASTFRDYVLVVASPEIEITVPALPEGVVGSTYAATLVATGGTAPYRWAVASGELPPGIALSAQGTVSGTPTAAGRFEFVVTATDVNDFVGTRTYVIDIEALASQVAIESSNNPSQAGEAVTFTVSVAAVAPGMAEAPSGVDAGVPGGGVTLAIDGATVATLTLDAAGTARYVTDALAPGSHTVVAEYAGDAGIAAGTAQLVQVVTTGTIAASPQPVPANGWWALCLMLAGVVVAAGVVLRRAG